MPSSSPNILTTDLQSLRGLWCNTNQRGLALDALDIDASDRGLTITTFSLAHKTSFLWTGLQHRYCGLDTADLIAFSIDQQDNNHYGLLQGNLNQGLLVLCSYFRKSGQHHYSREFFARSDSTQLSQKFFPSEAQHLFTGAATNAAGDLDPFYGRWINCDQGTVGLEALAIVDTPQGPALRLETGPTSTLLVDGLPLTAQVYHGIDESGLHSVSLVVDYDGLDVQGTLQIRWVAGTLVICHFSRQVADRPKANIMTREFFYRCQS